MLVTDVKYVDSEPLDFGFTLQRVVNKAGVPYSIILDTKKREVATSPTADEAGLLKYWEEEKEALARQYS